MEYAVVWKEAFKKKNESRYVTIRRDYPQKTDTKLDVAAYIKLRLAQGYSMEMDSSRWTNKLDGQIYEIIEYAFTNSTDVHNMWVGPAILSL